MKTRRNAFGLFRRYRAATFPSHDPDTEATLSDVVENAQPEHDIGNLSANFFRPYPNRNAFLLGEWYWNGGLQKTKSDFLELVNIICDPSFSPSDIRGVPWNTLNKHLGEGSDSEDMWLEEPDAGWMDTSITLAIPFRRSTPNPGLYYYTFPPFRHRHIVSVLKEKMADKHDFQHFHLEPYELRWHRKKHGREGIYQGTRRIIFITPVPESS